MPYYNSSFTTNYSPNQLTYINNYTSDYLRTNKTKDWDISNYTVSPSNIENKNINLYSNKATILQSKDKSYVFDSTVKRQSFNLRNTTGNLKQILRRIDFDAEIKNQPNIVPRKSFDYGQDKKQQFQDKYNPKLFERKNQTSYQFIDQKKYNNDLNSLNSNLMTEQAIKNQIKKIREEKQQRKKLKNNSYSSINLMTVNNNTDFQSNYLRETFDVHKKNPQTIHSIRKTSQDIQGYKNQQKQYNFSKKNKIDSGNGPKSSFDIEKKYQQILKKYEKDNKKSTKDLKYDINLSKTKDISKNNSQVISSNLSKSTNNYKPLQFSLTKSNQINRKKINQKVTIKDFQLGKSLGQGKFGTVYQALHKPTQSLYALKKVPKSMIKSHFMIDQFILQIKLQSFMVHQHLLALHGFFDDNQYIYLILDYMQEGTLYSLMKKKKKIPVAETALKIKQISKGIIYMHQNGIAHRDIKPQNIVMSNGTCKLCDFGWATLCDQRRKTYCGTFDYVAPEILSGNQYDTSVDIWCLGVLTYELLTQKTPFYHIKREQTKRKILNVQSQPLTFPQSMPPDAIDFIQRLLKKNPQQRLTIDQLLTHPFLANA